MWAPACRLQRTTLSLFGQVIPDVETPHVSRHASIRIKARLGGLQGGTGGGGGSLAGGRRVGAAELRAELPVRCGRARAPHRCRHRAGAAGRAEPAVRAQVRGALLRPTLSCMCRSCHCQVSWVRDCPIAECHGALCAAQSVRNCTIQHALQGSQGFIATAGGTAAGVPARRQPGRMRGCWRCARCAARSQCRCRAAAAPDQAVRLVRPPPCTSARPLWPAWPHH